MSDKTGVSEPERGKDGLAPGSAPEASPRQVIIVGAGLAGLSAACTALDAGAPVLLLEATGSLGGAGGRAEVSRAAEHWENSKDLTAQEQEAREWISKRLHIDFEDAGSEPPAGVLTLLALAQAISEWDTKTLSVVTGVCVKQLLVAPHGECCGCVYEHRDGSKVTAHGTVVLCCGGFASDSSQIARYRPDLLHLPVAFGAASGHTTSGLSLAMSAGAAAAGLDRIQVHATSLGSWRRRPLASKVLRQAGAVLLNQAGQRFCDELGEETEVACEIWRQEGPVRLVLDSTIRGAEWHKARCRDGGFLRRCTREALAQEMQVPLPRLERALQTRRATLGAGQEKSVSSEDDGSQDIWVAKVTPAVYCCRGGLLVGASGAVLGEDNRAIHGLYAAGEVTNTPQDSISPFFSCVASAFIASKAAVAACSSQAPLEAAPAEVRDGEPHAPGKLTPARRATGVREAVASRRLQKHLETKLTAEALQKALARASAAGGDLEKASEALIFELLGENSDGKQLEALCISLTDRMPPPLPKREVRRALPEVGQTATSQVSMRCVYCRLPLKLDVVATSVSEDVEKATIQPYSNGIDEGGPFAYTTVLFGSSAEYFLGALVLGWSLQANGCQADRLLIHTEDVPSAFLEGLEQYWTLRKVDYLMGARTLFENYEQSRFQAVFTKLQVLKCTDYAKVLMMDNDMLVRGNLDELFHLRAPAALKRCSGQEQPEHGGDFHAEDFWRSHRDGMFSGINAGIMLLEPDLTIYERMLSEIEDPKHPEHIGTDGPEQNYLARFYTTFGHAAWSHVHAKFNYQPMLPDDYVGSAHRSIDVIEDVVVAHYSGGMVKPWKIEGVALDAAGVRRYLEDDSIRNLMGQLKARGQQRRAPVTRIMDGVAVVQQPTSTLPENVRALMWEWVVALRQCNLELLEAGVDMLTLISDAQSL